MVQNILYTKISGPRPRQILQRPRLIETLDRCRDFPLVVISASTGFGKTSLLADFAPKSGMALAWYSLDETDRDPAVFCRGLLYSIMQAYPSFGASFNQLLDQNLKELHNSSLLDRLADEFINDLQVLKRQGNLSETLLVLDDFQFAESSSVNRFLQHLIWWLPDTFHIIIATRVLPEGLHLSRMLAKQMMFSLGPADLAFDEDEVNQLLKLVYGIENSELGNALLAYSEGWITAIILALANRKLADSRNKWLAPQTLSSMLEVEQLYNYLALEVFESQPVPLQNFLLRTSVFSVLSPASCARLVADSEQNEAESFCEEMLAQLESRNLFITHLKGETQSCFQYNSLFRHFLLSKLKEDSDRYKQAQLRAAQVQRAEGNYGEAVQHFVFAGEVSLAAELLNEIVGPLYEAGRLTFLASLLEMIPVEEHNKQPHLLRIKAQLLSEKGSNEAALQLYGQAEKIYQQEHSNDYEALVIAQQAQLLVRTGKRPEAVLLCSKVLGNKPDLLKSVPGQKAVALSEHNLGFVALEEGNSHKAEMNLKAAAAIYKVLNDKFRLAGIDLYMGALYHNTGRLIKSNIYYERALDHFIITGNRSREAYCRTSLAINSYLTGQYQLAEAQLNEIKALTHTLNDLNLRLFVLAYLANIHRELERPLKANQIYAEALQLAKEGNVRKLELLILNDWATNLILTGSKEEALAKIRLSLALADIYELPERAGLSYRTLCWLEFDRRSYKKALISIEQALEVFIGTKNSAEEARCKLAQATTLWSMGEPRKALVSLNNCLEQTDSLGYEPFLPFELKWAVPLFEYASHKKVSPLVEEFLRKRGYISDLEIPFSSTPSSEVEPEAETFLEPLKFSSRPVKKPKFIVQDEIASIETKAERSGLWVWSLDGGRTFNGDLEISKWRTNKAREAFFFLLENDRCTRDELWEALWPDEDFVATANLLKTNLFYLRKAIAPTAELKLSNGQYSLQGQIWYDAAEFRKAVKAALTGQEIEPNSLSWALKLYKKDFLSQFYSNWVLEKQQELLQLFLKGLDVLANYYENLSKPDLALPCWRQILIKDPYNEGAHRACIRALMKMGDQREALRQSIQCRKALEELELQPSPETALLLQKLA